MVFQSTVTGGTMIEQRRGQRPWEDEVVGSVVTAGR
jgi:hypothetical protein